MHCKALVNLYRRDADDDVFTQPAQAWGRDSPSREVTAPSGSQTCTNSTSPILRESGLPNVTTDDPSCGLPADSALSRQPLAAINEDSKTRRASPTHSNGLRSDILESGADPLSTNHAQSALLESALDATKLTPSESLLLQAQCSEREDQTGPPLNSLLTTLSRSTPDRIYTIQLARGPIQVSGAPQTCSEKARGKEHFGMKASAVDMLSDISALEHLGEDWRPSFVIDLSDPAARCRPTLKILHANASLESSRATLDLLEVDGEHAHASEEFVRFKNWILNAPDPSSQTIAPSHQYGGVRWTYVTLRHRFRFVSGDKAATLPSVPPDEVPQAPGTQHPAQGGARARGPEPADDTTGPAVKVSPEVPTAKFSFDWTRIPLTDDVPEHIRVARSVDWA